MFIYYFLFFRYNIFGLHFFGAASLLCLVQVLIHRSFSFSSLFLYFSFSPSISLPLSFFFFLFVFLHFLFQKIVLKNKNGTLFPRRSKNKKRKKGKEKKRIKEAGRGKNLEKKRMK